MINSGDAVVYAAFFMEGVRDKNYNDVLSSWGDGCVELFIDITKYAPFLETLVAAAIDASGTDSFPGVFEYEVCNPFGNWMATHVIETGELPSETECKDWLANEVIGFFGESDAVRDAVMRAREGQADALRLRFVAQAKDDYQGADVYVEDNADVRIVSHGAWVRSWVWVDEARAKQP